MFHVDIIPIVTCFAYTSYHFYTFFGTNLLTRCHSVSSCFLLFLYSRKVVLEIFSELDATKVGVPIFPTCTRSPKESRRGPGGWPHHTAARATPWPRHHQVWGSCRPPTLPFHIFIPFLGKTLNAGASIHAKFCSRCRRQP